LRAPVSSGVLVREIRMKLLCPELVCDMTFAELVCHITFAAKVMSHTNSGNKFFDNLPFAGTGLFWGFGV